MNKHLLNSFFRNTPLIGTIIVSICGTRSKSSSEMVPCPLKGKKKVNVNFFQVEFLQEVYNLGANKRIKRLKLGKTL